LKVPPSGLRGSGVNFHMIDNRKKRRKKGKNQGRKTSEGEKNERTKTYRFGKGKLHLGKRHKTSPTQ